MAFISKKDARRFAPRKNKYGAKRVTLDGIKFSSKREAQRYGQLKLLQRAGKILDLECHPKYKLVVNNKLICSYSADFRYMKDGKIVVEDVKSKATATYSFQIKKKLMAALHGIEVIEVY